jgi:hypothetical protein
MLRATQVAAWRVLGGSAPGAMHVLGQIPDSGFESSILLDTEPPEVTVQALSASGSVPGSATRVNPTLTKRVSAAVPAGTER